MMTFLNVICYCAVAAAIIALPFLLVNWVRYTKAQQVTRLVAFPPSFPTKSVNFFVIPIFIAMIAGTIITTYARYDALKFVQSLSGNYTVYVNEQQAPDPDKIISALKELAPYWAHHSHPTKRIRVDIHTDVRDLRLELGRDSQNLQEYWVFYPELDASGQNEIGRITTAAFDEY
jgi:hypothetical protein